MTARRRIMFAPTRRRERESHHVPWWFLGMLAAFFAGFALAVSLAPEYPAGTSTTLPPTLSEDNSPAGLFPNRKD